MKQAALLVDDHAAMRTLLKDYLRDEFDPIYEADNPDEGVALFKKHQPKLVIVDLIFPRLGQDPQSGLAAIRQMKAIQPDVDILIFSQCDDISTFKESIPLGLAGYVTKADAGIKQALDNYRAGLPYFSKDVLDFMSDPFWGNASDDLKVAEPVVVPDSEITLEPQQKKILELCASGLKTKDIAEQLGSTYKSIDRQLTKLKSIAGYSSVQQLVLWAARHGLIDINESLKKD